MKKMTLTNAIVGVLVGIGIILLACLVPLSELLNWILIIFGAITVVINTVNLFNKYDYIISHNKKMTEWLKNNCDLFADISTMMKELKNE